VENGKMGKFINKLYENKYYFFTHACHVPAVLHLVKIQMPSTSYLIKICHSCVALVLAPNKLRVPPPKVG
jgi:hypothetical protein